MHDTQITVVGNLAADPVHRRLDSGTKVTNFRIGSTPRRRTREGEWVDAETSWWEVTCFGFLAENTAACLRKGQRVLVSGRASVEQWSVRGQDGERSGTTARVTADAVGHDLAYGTSSFARVVRAVDLPVPSREEVAAAMGQRVDAHGELHPLEADAGEAAGAGDGGDDAAAPGHAGEPVDPAREGGSGEAGGGATDGDGDGARGVGADRELAAV